MSFLLIATESQIDALKKKIYLYLYANYGRDFRNRAYVKKQTNLYVNIPIELLDGLSRC